MSKYCSSLLQVGWRCVDFQCKITSYPYFLRLYGSDISLYSRPNHDANPDKRGHRTRQWKSLVEDSPKCHPAEIIQLLEDVVPWGALRLCRSWRNLHYPCRLCRSWRWRMNAVSFRPVHNDHTQSHMSRRLRSTNPQMFWSFEAKYKPLSKTLDSTHHVISSRPSRWCPTSPVGGSLVYTKYFLIINDEGDNKAEGGERT